MQFIAGTAVHNQAQHYTAASGGGALVNSRPCAQRYAKFKGSENDVRFVEVSSFHRNIGSVFINRP